ncbi:alpha/beta-hydrolase [Dacryopinax primogenitus]|uniref:Carboxylic ester hydrolase n=1 Tax=Dacryopinax primogenitus (strain DJM 731) TaxID=1858805 RepID=M5GBT1_DACPD|nr:alpha/beta-hydrolase [Dacryopinax primogenitus]EJU06449.1 alpha/beta-hydrolase [Dacryopinax primogenitus]
MKLLPAVSLGAWGVASVSATCLLDLGYARYSGHENTTTGCASILSFLNLHLKSITCRICVYYGVHHSQAPVGALRWEAPLPIEANNNFLSMGVINAATVGPTCIQGIPYWSNSTPGNPTSQEDCLRADVYMPIRPTSGSLPILVQVHGGGYTEGSSMSEPGDAIMYAANGSLVYVSIQYRLGGFGYLNSVEVRQNGSPNVGLLDQRAAMQWTQRYARYFGGDPSQITIIGGSAGGGSVMNQMILYGGVTSPPFRAAIAAEYPWWQPYKNDSALETQYRQLLTATGCSDLACLRALDETSLATASQEVYVQAYAAGSYGYGDFYFGPAVDGEIIRDLPSNEFKQGHFTKVPLLVNRDGYEGVIFSNLSVTTMEEELEDMLNLFPYAGQSFINRLYELYPLSAYNSTFYHRAQVFDILRAVCLLFFAFNSTFYHRAQLFGDAVVECPTYWLSSAVSDAGLPVYKVLFYAGSEVHGATSPYLYFENNDGTYMANDTIGAYMKDWMVSFTTHLDPNAVSYSGLDKPYWPVWSDQSTGLGWNAMDVNFTEIGVVRDYDVSERCDWFHSQNAVIRN